MLSCAGYLLGIDVSEHSKASFHVQLNKDERLTLASFEEKAKSSDETLVAQLQRKTGDTWKVVGTIKLLRQSNGTYKQLSE